MASLVRRVIHAFNINSNAIEKGSVTLGEAFQNILDVSKLGGFILHAKDHNLGHLLECEKLNTMNQFLIKVDRSIKPNIGDAVAIMHPRSVGKIIIRRVGAVEGDEIVSSDPEDQPFSLRKDELWIVSGDDDDKNCSTTYGPLNRMFVLGRAVYAAESAKNHCVVVNSEDSKKEDELFETYGIDFFDFHDEK